MKAVEKIIWLILISLAIWLTWSFFDVNAHNDILVDDGEPSKYNAFCLLIGYQPEEKTVEPVKRESRELATYEQNKGIMNIVPTKTVDQDDLYLLAHLIYGEAGASYCSDDMQVYVGSVVLNRVKSPDFPNTIEEVIFQKGQYACTWDGNFYREPDDRAWEIANDLLYYGSMLPDDVVFQAEFTQGSGIYIKEQNMYFCFK